MRVRFGEHLLDTHRRELSRGDEMIHVERQVYELLAFLLRNAERVVSKDEIMDAVWQGQIVSESALTSRVRSARLAIGDDGREQALIKTVHGIGYRFVGAFEVEPPDQDGPTTLEAERLESVPGTHERPASRWRIARPSKPLIGRADDRRAISAQLATRRLVTVVGPGGIGKTHLLTHLGAESLADFPDGVVLVRLADVQDDDAVATVCLEALGMTARSVEVPDEALLHALAELELLVILDNAEQVRAGTASVAERILGRCPGVKLLASSRRRLGVSGEGVHTLERLADTDARALFVEHARAHGVEFDEDREDVRSLCERLDGVPLALELASARTRLLSLKDVATRLDHFLSDAATTAEAEGRHRSVEAALSWSLATLTPDDRRLLRDLCVFAGSFDIEAANAVGGVPDATDGLLRLADHSLLVPLPTSESSQFRMLEPVRIFSASGEGETDSARRRHLRFYVDRAIAACAQVNGPDVDGGVGEFHTSWPNLRAAFAYARETGDVDAMTRLVLAVADFAELRLHREVLDWAQITRLAGPADETDLAEITSVEVRLALHFSELERAMALAPHLESAPQTSTVVAARAWVAWFGADLAQLEAHSKTLIEGGDRGNESGYRLLAVYSFDVIGAAIQRRSALDSANAVLALGTPSETHRAFSAMVEGYVALWERDMTRAAAALDLAADRFERLGYALLAISAASFRATVLDALGDEDELLRSQIDTLRLIVRSGRTSMMAVDFTRTAKHLAARGDDAAAARLLSAATQSPSPFVDTDEIVGPLQRDLAERLGRRFDEETRLGQDLPLVELARFAMERLEVQLGR